MTQKTRKTEVKKAKPTKGGRQKKEPKAPLPVVPIEDNLEVEKIIEEGKDNRGLFKPGNRIHELARNYINGRTPKFPTPGHLLEAALPYFEYIDENPFTQREYVITPTGQRTEKIKEFKRPYTWSGLAVFLGLYSLEYYRKKTEFNDVFNLLNEIMTSQKFEGAASGLFKENIIARELGLVDKTELEVNTSEKPKRREFRNYEEINKNLDNGSE